MPDIETDEQSSHCWPYPQETVPRFCLGWGEEGKPLGIKHTGCLLCIAFALPSNSPLMLSLQKINFFKINQL